MVISAGQGNPQFSGQGYFNFGLFNLNFLRFGQILDTFSLVASLNQNPHVFQDRDTTQILRYSDLIMPVFIAA